MFHESIKSSKGDPKFKAQKTANSLNRPRRKDQFRKVTKKPTSHQKKTVRSVRPAPSSSDRSHRNSIFPVQSIKGSSGIELRTKVYLDVLFLLFLNLRPPESRSTLFRGGDGACSAGRDPDLVKLTKAKILNLSIVPISIHSHTNIHHRSGWSCFLFKLVLS